MLIVIDCRCPRVFHLQCVGLKQLPSWQWTCPQHACSLCSPENAKKTKLSNMSMRCVICPASFCVEHQPPKEDYLVVYDWWPFIRQGFSLSPKKNYCYISCSPACTKEARRLTAIHDLERAALPDAAEEEAAKLAKDAEEKAAALQQAELAAKAAAKKAEDAAAAKAKKAAASEAAKIWDATMRLPVGSSILVHGLSAQVQYNGMIGSIHRFDEKQRRLIVKLNDVHLAIGRAFIAQLGLKVQLLASPHEGQLAKIIGVDYSIRPPSVKLATQSDAPATVIARMEDVLFADGTALKLVDLESKPNFNGEWGVVKGFDRQADRYTIALTRDAVKLSVKRCNVSL